VKLNQQAQGKADKSFPYKRCNPSLFTCCSSAKEKIVHSTYIHTCIPTSILLSDTIPFSKRCSKALLTLFHVSRSSVSGSPYRDTLVTDTSSEITTDESGCGRSNKHDLQRFAEGRVDPTDLSPRCLLESHPRKKQFVRSASVHHRNVTRGVTHIKQFRPLRGAT